MLIGYFPSLSRERKHQESRDLSILFTELSRPPTTVADTYYVLTKYLLSGMVPLIGDCRRKRPKVAGEEILLNHTIIFPHDPIPNSSAGGAGYATLTKACAQRRKSNLQ